MFFPVNSTETLTIRNMDIKRIFKGKFEGSSYSNWGLSWTNDKLELSEDEWKQLPPGHYEIKAEFLLSVVEEDSNTGKQTPALSGVAIQQVASFEVVPPDVSTLSLTNDPMKEPIIKLARQIRLLPANEKKATGQLEICAEFVDTAFDIFLRIDGVEMAAGDVDIERRPRTWHNVDIDCELGANSSPGDTIDIILRPNVARAEQSVGLMEIWNKPIEILDVPIRK